MAASPRIVGRYELIGVAGRGGMGVVYVAHQVELGRDVALKELAAFHIADQEVTERFLRESRLAGSLSHPNIVTVLDAFEDDGIPYLAMEYLERGSLRRLIGHLSFAQTVGVLEGVLAGLVHADQHGVVHRDIKPENLLITREGGIKIADFGIAKALSVTIHGGPLTATGTAVGTPAYMAPEQAMGQEVTARTDLYSVGAMAFELVAGRVPFPPGEAETPLAVLLKHVNEPPPDLLTVAPGADPELARWVHGLLAKEPQARPDARTAWEALEDIAVRRLGPLWRREAALPELEAQVPRPLPTRATVASPAPAVAVTPPTAGMPAPPPAATVTAPPAEPRGRSRRPQLIGGAVVLAAAAAAGIVLATSGGGGGNEAAIDSSVPSCVKKFVGGAHAETVVPNTETRIPKVEGKPVGFVLGPGRSIGAVLAVYHPKGEQSYFEVQGVIDATTCRRVGFRNASRGGTASTFPPWDTLRLGIARAPHYLRLGYSDKPEKFVAADLQYTNG
jgi:Protein kinase domain